MMCGIYGLKDLGIEKTLTELFTQAILGKESLKQQSGTFTK